MGYVVLTLAACTLVLLLYIYVYLYTQASELVYELRGYVWTVTCEFVKNDLLESLLTGVCSFCSQSLFNCKILVQASTCYFCRPVLIFTFCSDMMSVFLCIAHFCVTSYCSEKFLSMSSHVPRIFFFSFITLLLCIEKELFCTFAGMCMISSACGVHNDTSVSYVYRQHFCMHERMCSCFRFPLKFL